MAAAAGSGGLIVPFGTRTGYRTTGSHTSTAGPPVPVDPSRQVVAVTLPNRSGTVNTLVNAAHVFAVTTGTPGATLSHDGLSFTWPDVPAGLPDNVLALGQTVLVSGTG
ncbi:MAG TPA: hypothetical protein VGG16_01530, partial [Streptosporangiaceae bacterium]